MNRLFHTVLLIGTIALSTAISFAAETSQPASILDTVKSTGTLTCGVIREEEDYSKADTHGNRAALDRDICKAILAAVVGDKGKVVIATYPDEPTAIKALSEGKVEIIATATPNFVNRTSFHIGFSPVVFFDGQGFLVKKADGLKSAKDLDSKKVCFIDETTNAVYLPLYGAREKIKFFPFPFEEEGEMEAAMYTANCAAMTTDITQLANTRALFGTRAKEFELLPEVITKDPLAVAYREEDSPWANAVIGTISAIIQAEESSVTSANVDTVAANNTDPSVRVYFSPLSNMATTLSLDSTWAIRVIKAVGNYGEMYDRDLGGGSPLQIPRGQNALWNKGGLIYAPPAVK
jgi:general L-amino acid transport system substrate-binding protein